MSKQRKKDPSRGAASNNENNDYDNENNATTKTKTKTASKGDNCNENESVHSSEMDTKTKLMSAAGEPAASSRSGSPSKSSSGAPNVSENTGSKKLLAIVMQQNSQLEREIQRLHAEIDEITKGVLKRGYLYKFRDREISFASKWGLRYFVLQGSTISYFVDDKELRPRRSFNLVGCIVKDEGPSKHGGHYHVFSIYYPVEYEPEDQSPPTGEENLVGSLLLRLSSENKAEAAQWIALLRKACAKEPVVPQILGLHVPAPSKDQPHSECLHVDTDTTVSTTDDWTHAALDEIEEMIGSSHDGSTDKQAAEHPAGNDVVSEIAKEALDRVRSATLILQQSQSRSSLAANVGGADGLLPPGAKSITLDSSDSLRPFSPSSSDMRLKVSASGKSLLRMADHEAAAAAANPQHAGKKPSSKSDTDKKRRFPASKPIHVGSRFSPLSAESRPSEQNYRGFFNLVSLVLLVIGGVVSPSI